MKEARRDLMELCLVPFCTTSLKERRLDGTTYWRVFRSRTFEHRRAKDCDQILLRPRLKAKGGGQRAEQEDEDGLGLGSAEPVLNEACSVPYLPGHSTERKKPYHLQVAQAPRLAARSRPKVDDEQPRSTTTDSVLPGVCSCHGPFAKFYNVAANIVQVANANEQLLVSQVKLPYRYLIAKRGLSIS
ncbi:hypothetical protein BDN72DRAFT_864141 [Pluteus cervinus]|uniref:Uncharacterized protein n=1 Tax=Pluteus cervinus TaxID=181527 RepID=A0ACD3A4T3_9AGAR|nr:hypothetical protein BDN72DRAFT_864141 [Pluteus cervinus]